MKKGRMTMTVQIENIQSKVEIPQSLMELLEKSVELCILKESIEVPWEINIYIVDNDSIAELNKQHRNIDAATDVLSFPLINAENGALMAESSDINPETGGLMLGEIVISAEKAVSQAEELGHSLEREFVFLVTHGVYHTLGFDHLTETESELMIRKQEAVLNEMNLHRNKLC